MLSWIWSWGLGNEVRERGSVMKILYSGENGSDFRWSLTCLLFRAVWPFSLRTCAGYLSLTTFLGPVSCLWHFFFSHPSRYSPGLFKLHWGVYAFQGHRTSNECILIQRKVLPLFLGCNSTFSKGASGNKFSFLTVWPLGVALLKTVRGPRARGYGHMPGQEGANRDLSSQGPINSSRTKVFHSAVAESWSWRGVAASPGLNWCKKLHYKKLIRSPWVLMSLCYRLLCLFLMMLGKRLRKESMKDVLQADVEESL